MNEVLVRIKLYSLNREILISIIIISLFVYSTHFVVLIIGYIYLNYSTEVCVGKIGAVSESLCSQIAHIETAAGRSAAVQCTLSVTLIPNTDTLSSSIPISMQVKRGWPSTVTPQGSLPTPIKQHKRIEIRIANGITCLYCLHFDLAY